MISDSLRGGTKTDFLQGLDHHFLDQLVPLGSGDPFLGLACWSSKAATLTLILLPKPLWKPPSPPSLELLDVF